MWPGHQVNVSQETHRHGFGCVELHAVLQGLQLTPLLAAGQQLRGPRRLRQRLLQRLWQKVLDCRDLERQTGRRKQSDCKQAVCFEGTNTYARASELQVVL